MVRPPLLRKVLTWLGLALSLLSVLSYFLLATSVSFAMAFLVGDPRRFGLALAFVGFLLLALGLGLTRSATKREQRWTVAAFVVSVFLGCFYVLGTYVFTAFRQENIRFSSGATELAGTLMTPRGRGPHPAVIFMHGGLGAEFIQSRWSFYHLASHFARRGLVTLSYDKRGHGGSSGPRSDELPFQALADDALAGLTFLQRRAEIDPNQIGLWATSQGGWTAPLAASQGDVAFLMIVSGGGATPAQE